MIRYLINRHFTVEKWSNLRKMKLNEPARQKLDRYRNPVSRHSMKSYILTYFRLRKREALIALSSHQRMEGGLISASAVPKAGHSGGKGYTTVGRAIRLMEVLLG